MAFFCVLGLVQLGLLVGAAFTSEGLRQALTVRDQPVGQFGQIVLVVTWALNVMVTVLAGLLIGQVVGVDLCNCQPCEAWARYEGLERCERLRVRPNGSGTSANGASTKLSISTSKWTTNAGAAASAAARARIAAAVASACTSSAGTWVMPSSSTRSCS
jgi:hypothetical protein